MKAKIYEAIKKSGKNGIRLRDIGYYCNVWHVSCLEYVAELVEEGKVYGKTIGHGWQAYIKYYVKEV
jgi:predicted transcriptional regulator